MKKCACPTCEEKIEIPDIVNVGEFADSTGWKAIFVEDLTFWLCPIHKEKVEKLAIEIFGFVGTPYAYFPTLLPKKFEG